MPLICHHSVILTLPIYHGNELKASKRSLHAQSMLCCSPLTRLQGFKKLTRLAACTRSSFNITRMRKASYSFQLRIVSPKQWGPFLSHTKIKHPKRHEPGQIFLHICWWLTRGCRTGPIGEMNGFARPHECRKYHNHVALQFSWHDGYSDRVAQQ